MQKRIDDIRRAADRARGRSGPNWIAAGAAAAGGAVAGILGAYLLDPTRGRARRARLGDQAAAVARDGAAGVQRTARQVGDTARTTVARIRHAGDEGQPMPNDAATQDKVQTELFRDPAVPQGDINVNVEAGIVVLRGEVPDEEMRHRLVETAGAVPGVWSVRDLLHLPGEPAPTVAAGS